MKKRASTQELPPLDFNQFIAKVREVVGEGCEKFHLNNLPEEAWQRWQTNVLKDWQGKIGKGPYAKKQ